MDVGIAGRIALVTGASSGLGRAVALALAAEGATLAVAARRQAELETLVREAHAAGAPKARAFALDLSDAASVAAMLDGVRDAFGGVDIAILNGGGPKPGTCTSLSLDDWDNGYRVTLRCMLQIVEGVLPRMRAAQWGRIVALTSSTVKQPIANLALSNSFRVALVAALKTLSNEVARDGITVNSIATGRVITDRLRELYPDEAALHRAAESEIPIGRVATPQEFAPLVAFLCGEPARYVTGQTIGIDGGLIRGLFG